MFLMVVTIRPTRTSLVAPSVKNLPECGRPGFNPWVGKIPWRRERQPTPVSLPGESHGQRSLVGCSPWGLKESGMTGKLTHTYIPETHRAFSAVKNLPDYRRRRLDPGVGKIPWRRAWHPTPVFQPGESRGQRSLAGYSPWGRKEPNTTEATLAHMRKTYKAAVMKKIW